MVAIEKRERKESKVFTEPRNKIETLAEFCEVVGGNRGCYAAHADAKKLLMVHAGVIVKTKRMTG